jgi:hypothetical protein
MRTVNSVESALGSMDSASRKSIRSPCKLAKESYNATMAMWSDMPVAVSTLSVWAAAPAAPNRNRPPLDDPDGCCRPGRPSEQPAGKATGRSECHKS